MHSLIGLAADGTPLTRSLTWADSRAGAQAERLRASPIGLPLHRRTGTPIHPMSPLTKLMWFREHEPALWPAGRALGRHQGIRARTAGRERIGRVGRVGRVGPV